MNNSQLVEIWNTFNKEIDTIDIFEYEGKSFKQWHLWIWSNHAMASLKIYRKINQTSTLFDVAPEYVGTTGKSSQFRFNLKIKVWKLKLYGFGNLYALEWVLYFNKGEINVWIYSG